MKRIAPRRVAGALAFSLLFLLLAPTPSSAHPEGDAHHKPMPSHASEVMRAFLDDHHGAEDLEALAANSCVGGMADGTYPCNNVDLEAFLPIADIGGTASQSEANDIWGWTDPLTGREYALIGLVFGTSFIDVTVPSNPVYLGELPTHGAFGSDWRDIKVHDNHAYIVSEARNHGMQVFDLTQLRGLTGNPPLTFGETAHYNKVASSHNIVINEDSGFAYIVGAAGKNSCDGGLHMVDLSIPDAPAFAGCFSADGYTHDAQCVSYDGPDPDHLGSEICLASNEDTITIVDVTDKANPVQISRTGYPGARYTHQGWLTEDRNHFLVDDELDETGLGHNTRTRIFDVSDLDAPVLDGFYESGNRAIDHNQYIKGDYSYQANYRSGLRILDISDVANTNLTEVAYFDIYPTDDAAAFNGAWSNYPYFDSGIVIVSGIEQGLFVLRPNLDGGGGDTAPTVSVTAPTSGSTVSGTVTVSATASDDVGVARVEFFADGDSIGADSAAPYSVSWDSTSVADGTVSITATATDTVDQTGSDSVNITVDNVADTVIHVGDLDGSAAITGPGGRWEATVTITVVDSGGGPVGGVTVAGSWSGGGGGSASCVTNGSGVCDIVEGGIRRNSSSATFTVVGLTKPGAAYDPGANQDPDGDSDGTTIVVIRP